MRRIRLPRLPAALAAGVALAGIGIAVAGSGEERPPMNPPVAVRDTIEAPAPPVAAPVRATTRVATFALG